MLHVLGLLYIITKGLAYLIKHEILFHLNRNNLIFFFVLIIAVILCKKLLKYKKTYIEFVDHFMEYRFKSQKDFYYSLIILFSTIVFYIIIVFYLRLRASNNPMNLYVIYIFLRDLYSKMSKGLICYNLFILCLMIYFFILVVKIIKKRLNIHLTKMHFYLISYPGYLNDHNRFRDRISIDGGILDPLYHYSMIIQHYVFCIYLFGYNKKRRFKNIQEERIPLAYKTKRYIWTKEESELYDNFNEKYGCDMIIRDHPLRVTLFNLHFIVLIVVVIYDILYNNYILTHVALILPFLFLYQIYVFLSQFVKDKIVYDVSAEINTLYYKNIETVSDKVVMIDGEIFERPDYEQIFIDFLRYEATEFHNTRMKH